MSAPIAIEQHSVQPARCRSCGARIEWAVTWPRARRMPFDAPIAWRAEGDATRPPGIVLVDMAVTTSHFATCPDAARWRQNKAPRGARVT